MFVNGLMLGLANGATCLAACAPLLVPLFLGESQRPRCNWGLLARFLGGRLAGYLLFGMLAWGLNDLVLSDLTFRSRLYGATYLLLAGLMLFYGLRRRPLACLPTPRGLRTQMRRLPWLVPSAMGLLTGLNLCPPFLLALSSAAMAGSLVGSLAFFAAFFCGTSFYLLAMPLLGSLPKLDSLRWVGKLAALLMSGYYAISGSILIYQGVTL